MKAHKHSVIRLIKPSFGNTSWTHYSISIERKWIPLHQKVKLKTFAYQFV